MTVRAEIAEGQTLQWSTREGRVWLVAFLVQEGNESKVNEIGEVVDESDERANCNTTIS